jgi:hypothetical protein
MLVRYTCNEGPEADEIQVAQYLCEWARADELKTLTISVGPINAFEPDLLHLAAKVLVQLLALPTGANGGYPRLPLELPDQAVNRNAAALSTAG